MTDLNKSIGLAVAAARGERTQLEVTDAMRGRGVRWSPTTIAMVERGERRLKLDEAKELADVLDTSVEAFLVDVAEGVDLARLRRVVRYAEDRWRAGEMIWQEYVDAAEVVQLELEAIDAEVNLDDEDELYLVVLARTIIGREAADLADGGRIYPAGERRGER